MRCLSIAVAVSMLAVASPGSAGPEKVTLPPASTRQVLLGAADGPVVKQLRDVFTSLQTRKATRPLLRVSGVWSQMSSPRRIFDSAPPRARAVQTMARRATCTRN
jgi:hypothetical protein